MGTGITDRTYFLHKIRTYFKNTQRDTKSSTEMLHVLILRIKYFCINRLNFLEVGINF